MATAADLETGLAYDIEGTGTPVVFVHGLTFDRRTWRPVIDRLDGSVTSIAIDLPAHGDSGGEPAAASCPRTRATPARKDAAPVARPAPESRRSVTIR